MDKKWWKEAIGYQIYIRSFKDSNNDGIGDLGGIIEKLDYLSLLGVNLIWVCPFYQSPMDDNGYDVSNFYQVASEYGNNEDLIDLINDAHQRGIKIIIDLILNHTSDEHPWFQESKKSINNPYRDYYIWQKPRYINGERKEPTNWASFFGGSCWKYDETTNEYYMKIFSDKMPDLNWENPKVIDEFVAIITYYCELGVDGFRIDAISHLAKAEFIDSNIPSEEPYVLDYWKFSNQPKLHDYLRLLNEKVFSKYDIVLVGEAGGGAGIDDAIKFIKPENKEVNMVFNFDHNWCNNTWEAKKQEDLVTDLPRLKEMFFKWQTGLFPHGWNAIYWLNHDQPRVLSHYGDPINYREESAKMLATALYFMWGTPFIYNGEEIGMINPNFQSINDFRDKPVINQYYKCVNEKNESPEDCIKRLAISSRDSSRSIMQWDSSLHGGFSKVQPWNIIGDYHLINVEDQIKRSDSIFKYYQKIIDLRKNGTYKDVIVYGSYEPVYYEHPQIYGYMRMYGKQSILVLCNFTDQKAKIENFSYSIKNIILSNYNKNNFEEFLPYEAVVLEIDIKENIKI